MVFNMQAPSFAAPRPSGALAVAQKPDLKPSRHSAPGPDTVPHIDQASAEVSKAEAEPNIKKGLMRHSLPAVPRKPLACVSNKVLPKAKASESSIALSGGKRSASGSQQADGDTLPIRKRKLDHSAPPRATPVRTVNDDDGDFA